jgi:hypothetical protein
MRECRCGDGSRESKKVEVLAVWSKLPAEPLWLTLRTCRLRLTTNSRLLCFYLDAMSLLWKHRLRIIKPLLSPSLSRSAVRWTFAPDPKMPPSSPRARSPPRSEGTGNDTELARRVLDTTLEYLKASVSDTSRQNDGDFSARVLNILKQEERSSNWQKGLQKMRDELPHLHQDRYDNLLSRVHGVSHSPVLSNKVFPRQYV